MKAYLKAIIHCYADLFFISNAAIAGLIILAVTFVNPQIALAGIIAIVAAYLGAILLRMDKQFLEYGYYTYNPLLVGMSIGYLFNLTPLSILFIVVAGILTFLVTIFLANFLMTYLRLPVLSMPFVIVSTVAYLATVHYKTTLSLSSHTGFSFLSYDFGLPFWLAGFFKASGAILFAPSVAVGILLCLILLRHSRILFLLAALGYYAGTAIHILMTGSATAAFADTNSFNYIFIAMAVGGIFLIPSINSYLLAIIAVAIASIVMDATSVFWYYYGVPVFTLPFNIVTLGMIYVLALVRHPMVPVNMGRTPEETLESFLANNLRFRDQFRTLYLPFIGCWTVWQGFQGAWTHKGKWSNAYDFVISDENGDTHSGSGADLDDYYCFNKPVLAPTRGRVVQVIDNLPSNAIGDADELNRWGNLVIIQDPRGFYVEISHFAEKSITVKKDDWVEHGAFLGLCGNSGYSPQPHIHIQVQAAEIIGDTTLPFSFVSYIDNGEYQSNNIPPEKNVIEPLYRDKHLENTVAFIIDDEQCYTINHNKKVVGELKMKVKMASDSTFYFETTRGQLYFGKSDNTFYLYRLTGDDPWLRLLFRTLPRMPLTYREGMTWSDNIPQGIVSSRLYKVIKGFFSAIWQQLATKKVTLRFINENRIESTIDKKCAYVELDRNKGFARVEAGGFVFERKS
ncbi:MAG: urea transporter [bacterium]